MPGERADLVLRKSYVAASKTLVPPPTRQFHLQGLPDYALHSVGGQIMWHTPVFRNAPVPFSFRLHQHLALLLPSVFSEPIHPQASQVLSHPWAKQKLTFAAFQNAVDVLSCTHTRTSRNPTPKLQNSNSASSIAGSLFLMAAPTRHGFQCCSKF